MGKATQFHPYVYPKRFFYSGSRGNPTYLSYLETIRLGLSRGPGPKSVLHERLYRDFVDLTKRNKHSAQNAENGDFDSGGIFNLEFTEDGKILAAACERRKVLLMDPNREKPFKSMNNAHGNCVNCVKFLDSRTFATCSDDTTVALWDIRRLDKRIRTLRGHSKWVKNVEFSKKENLLVTSGFDGAIHLWDVDKYSEEDTFNRVFHTSGLMRMRISALGDKMVISTMNGYLIVVHDLDLQHFENDLKDFKPNMYRLMQMSGVPMKTAVESTKLFHAKRNRVEFITDFAPENDAEAVTGLQLHPQGWAAVSRNISTDEMSEWCSVHDIHVGPPKEDEDEEIQPDGTFGQQQQSQQQQQQQQQQGSGLQHLAEIISAGRGSGSGGQNRRQSPSQEQRAVISVDLTVRDADGLPSVRIVSETVREESSRILRASSPEPLVSNERRAQQQQQQQQDDGVLLLAPNGLSRSNNSNNRSWVYFGTPSSHRSEIKGPTEGKLHYNKPRLTHYIEESNTGRGFIKEVSFSPDGRVICSPFGFGARLLAFDEFCSDLSYSSTVLQQPTVKKLYEVGMIDRGHDTVVLSSAFSPHVHTLVTGCLGGHIAWHHPRP